MGLKDLLFGKRANKKQDGLQNDSQDQSQSHKQTVEGGKVEIIIPKESFELVEGKDEEGAKSLMVVNSALRTCKEDSLLKRVFGYCCTVTLDYVDIDGNQWPSSKEFSVMQEYTEALDKGLKVDSAHPNALFVARNTYKGTCQVIWMVNNPDLSAQYLDGIIASGKQVREFEYCIEGDPEWKSIDWVL